MKRMTLAILSLATLPLAACQVPLDFQEEPVDFVQLDSRNTPPVIGKSYLGVRTYLAVPDGDPVEIAGAACVVRSSQFRAEFQSPARMSMPLTRGEPKPLKLACRANGKSQQLDLPPVQIVTGVGIYTGELVTSLAATLIVGGVTTEASRNANVWGYRYRGEKVMGLENEIITLRLVLE